MELGKISAFNSEINLLVKTGIPLPEGLASAARDAEDPNLSNLFQDVKNDLESGKSLSDSLRKNGFPMYYRALMEAGEKAGDIQPVLSRLVEYFEARQRLYVKMRSAISYPLLQLAVACTIIPVACRVVTMFGSDAEFHSHIAQKRAWTVMFVRFVQDLSHFSGQWLLPVAVIASAWLVYQSLRPSDSAAILMLGITTRLPLFGRLLKFEAYTRLCQSLAQLLKSGIPVGESLRCIAASEPDPAHSAACIAASELIDSGQGISESFTRCGILPGHAAYLLESGEKNGDVPELLEDMARWLEGETTVMARIVPQLWEVMLVLFTGLVVGALIISVVTPMIWLSSY